MTERVGMTREEILSAFPPQQEIITGKNGDVTYRVSRNEERQIVYAVPETEWFKRGE